MKELILNTVEDLVSDFLYYDRKEDEELEVGMIEKAIVQNNITVNEITDHFKNLINENLNDI